MSMELKGKFLLAMTTATIFSPLIICNRIMNVIKSKNVQLTNRYNVFIIWDKVSPVLQECLVCSFLFPTCFTVFTV